MIKTPRRGASTSAPRLDLSGARPPLGPSQHACSSLCSQEAFRCGARSRKCLLKGCECVYFPSHPLCRYCSEACRQAARRWSRWLAAMRYRSSEQGKQVRQEQARRYRERVRQREQQGETPAEVAGEGHHKAGSAKRYCCCRPGCYDQFSFSARSPLQKFCSPLCRQALYRVRKREARWILRLFGKRSKKAPVLAIDLSPAELRDTY